MISAADKEKQKGVTLLLTILILAAITAIVFSVAAIALNETRTSGDLIKTEPAITAAEAGAEDILFRDLQGAGSYSTNCSSPTVTTLSNNVVLQSCANIYYSNPYEFKVSPSGQQVFYLYDPTNIGGPSGYTSFQINYISGPGTVTVNWYAWNKQVGVDSPDASIILSPSGSSTYAPADLSTSQYQVAIVNNNPGGLADFVITTTPKGMPADQTTINTTGLNNGVTRKIQTVIPK